MTETASAQNRNYPGTTIALPSGATATADSEGRLIDIPANDAEWLISTPGWSRVGEEPARPAMINPLGQRPPEAPIATELGDPTAKLNDLADHLIDISGESEEAAEEVTDDAVAAADEETKPVELPTLAEEVKAAKKRGITIPKAVKAKGADAVRKYMSEAKTR